MKLRDGDVGQVTMVMSRQDWAKARVIHYACGCSEGGGGGGVLSDPLRPTSFVVDVRLHCLDPGRN